MEYLNCYFDKVATGTCFANLGINWGDYQMSFYREFCGSIPASVMAQIQVP